LSRRLRNKAGSATVLVALRTNRLVLRSTKSFMPLPEAALSNFSATHEITLSTMRRSRAYKFLCCQMGAALAERYFFTQQ
jgi:hypothetical protein